MITSSNRIKFLNKCMQAIGYSAFLQPSTIGNSLDKISNSKFVVVSCAHNFPLKSLKEHYIHPLKSCIIEGLTNLKGNLIA